jgi:hypothetical protein
MPILGSFAAGSKGGYGKGGKKSDPIDVDYLVIAGGGGGGFNDTNGGGGGAGGYRTSFPGGSKLTVDSGNIPITIGAGGVANPNSAISDATGTDSTFQTITSSGGGGGGPALASPIGRPGGSGGGTTDPNSPAPGNAGGYSPPEGNPGAPGSPPSGGGQSSGGGGGGSGGSGNTGQPTQAGGGGQGTASSITGSSVTRAGGGGASANFGASPGPGGPGGGGDGGKRGQPGVFSQSGAVNTGSGGGADQDSIPTILGGSGVIIIQAPGASAPLFSASPGANTITTAPGGETVITFTTTGTLRYT